MPTKLDVSASALVDAVELDREGVAGLVLGDELAEALGGDDVLAAGLDDQVAAELIALAGDDDLRRPPRSPALLRAASGDDALDEDSALNREPELLLHRGCDRAAEDTEQRVIDPAMRLELRDDVPHRVDRNRKADAGVLLERAPPQFATAELTPITWPWALSSGPPELPWFRSASVWITRSIGLPSGDRSER